jgi:hypothetical protein
MILENEENENLTSTELLELQKLDRFVVNQNSTPTEM